MAKTDNKNLEAKVFKKTKVEVHYEYVPILGAVLGFWKRIYEDRFGEGYHLEISAPINEFNSFFINGRPVKIIFPEETKTTEVKLEDN